MSELLDALIQERRKQAISYQEYLERIKQLAHQVKQPTGTTDSAYPPSLDTPAKRSLYDNLGKDEALALRIDTAVRYTKKEGWGVTASKSGRSPMSSEKKPEATT
jgi:type I restriction enzyme R subunit